MDENSNAANEQKPFSRSENISSHAILFTFGIRSKRRLKK